MNKKAILAITAILGSSAIASSAVVDIKSDNDTVDNKLNSVDFKNNRSKEFALKVNFNNIEDSFGCFHSSHSSHASHASHASHSSHSSSSFV